MGQKWIRIWGRDFQRGCLYQIIAVLIVVPLFAACILVPLYFANRPGVTEREFLLITIIPAVLFLIALFGGGFGFLFWSLRKRAAWLDAIFVPFGLEGGRYAGTGRQYHGQIRGREADVLFVRGPMLTIYLSTDVFTRAAISAKEDISQNFARMFNKSALDWGDDELAVFAHDDEWGRRFMDEPEVQSLLKGLILDESPFYIRQVQFEPGLLLLRLYRSNKMFGFEIPAAQGKRWIEHLIRLAELAEAQSPPDEKLPPSSLTEKLREGRASRWGWLIVGLVFLMAGCLMIASIGIIFIIEGGF